MTPRRNILRSLQITIVAVLLVTLALGTTGFMAYFRGVFAPNVLAGVKTVTDQVNVELQNRETEFTARKRALESDYVARLSHDLAILQQTIPSTLWNVEAEAAEGILRAFLEREEISGIRVDDEAGKLFAALQKVQGKPQAVKDANTFKPEGKPLSTDLTRTGKKVGSVVLFYFETPLQRQLAQVDADLLRFQQENSSLIASINTSLGTTIATQAERILVLRGLELGAVFLVTAVVLSLFIRFRIVGPLGVQFHAMARSAAQIKVAAAQVASGSTVVAEETSKEAAAVEETSATVEELSAMTHSNAQHAAETDRLMKETRATVTQAGESMRGLFDSIQEIQRSSAETSKIIRTIDEIAFQTNILALNAAVEAARAGEHGAGFAVVADEVRTLARRSATAAKDTASLIENTHRQVSVAGRLVEETRGRFTEVGAHVAQSGELAAKIAQSSSEQSKGIEQLNSAVLSIDKAVQHTVATAEESAAASQEMRDQSDKVDQVITDLRIMVGAGMAAAPSGVEVQAAPLAAPVFEPAAALHR